MNSTVAPWCPISRSQFFHLYRFATLPALGMYKWASSIAICVPDNGQRLPGPKTSHGPSMSTSRSGSPSFLMTFPTLRQAANISSGRRITRSSARLSFP